MKAPETQPEETFVEERLSAAGKNFPYPKQPDIVQAVVARTKLSQPRPGLRPFAIGILVVGILCVGLLMVPPARAAFIRIIQVGVIQVFLEPTPTPQGQAIETVPPTPLPDYLKLTGETTLADAREEVRFDIPLPTYPPDLEEPDHIFVQDMGGQVVVLIWLDPKQNNHIQLSLMIMGPGSIVGKSAPQTLEHTFVHQVQALWMEGNHVLFLDTLNGNEHIQLSVLGNVLIWEQNGITYRLESDLPLVEARQIAESLK